MKYPYLQGYRAQQIVTTEFLGLNMSPETMDGECHSMLNLSPRLYPMLSTKKSDIKGNIRANVQGLLVGDGIITVENNNVYINANLAMSGMLTDGKKTLVRMGAYLLIFPDKVYMNLTNYNDYGRMEASATVSGVVVKPARNDGGQLPDNIPYGTSAPTSPNDGDYWVDTRGDTAVLRQYSALSDTWAEVPSTYVRIEGTGIDTPFDVGDSVNISGIGIDEALNGYSVIEQKGSGWILIQGLVKQVYSLPDASVTLERKLPDLDYVIENNNRLWGCKYGVVDGKTVNAIYASKLGDFKNWNVFQGIATDAWAAGVGGDGQFTGAIAYQGYPMFFKENMLYRVAGNTPETFTVIDTPLRGVKKGCSHSLVIVNEYLYYVSNDGVMVFDGSIPVKISGKLGDVQLSDASGGAYNQGYVLSVNASAARLFFYDTGKRLWYEWGCNGLTIDRMQENHVADETFPAGLMGVSNGELVLVEGDIEESLPWSLETGVTGYEFPNRKYISRLNMRVELGQGATLKAEIQYNSDGEWRTLGEKTNHLTTPKTAQFPLRPRRCDHFNLRLTGTGQMRMYSYSRELEAGTDGMYKGGRR